MRIASAILPGTVLPLAFCVAGSTSLADDPTDAPPRGPAMGGLTLVSVTPPLCRQVGDPVVIQLRLEQPPAPLLGYQTFIQFDPARLTFVSGQYALPDPFGLPIIFPIQANVSGVISVAAGVNVFGGQPPATAPATLVTLQFTAASLGDAVVGFVANAQPPTRLTGIDQEFLPTLTAAPTIRIRTNCTLGDMNCDGFVTVGDIAGFVLALTNPAQYAIQFPACNIGNGDINQDGFVTVGDIGPFVALLTSL